MTYPEGAWTPFNDWFTRTPEATFHGTAISMEDGMGRARILAQCPEGGDLDALIEDTLGGGHPGAKEFRLAQRGRDAAILDTIWQEPIFPGIRSPMDVAIQALGDKSRFSWFLERRQMMQRVLAPGGADLMEYWPKLRDELMRFTGWAQVDMRIELVHVRRAWIVADSIGIMDAAHAAWDLGLTETPPTCTPRIASWATGMTEDVLARGVAAFQRGLGERPVP